jgi:hypothetical protein
MTTTSSHVSAGTLLCAERIARTIGRSNPDPLFGTEAGDRLITTRLLGHSRPLLIIADRTLSRAWTTAVSPNPTMLIPGSPRLMSHSTVTGMPLMPDSAIPVAWPTRTGE